MSKKNREKRIRNQMQKTIRRLDDITQSYCSTPHLNRPLLSFQTVDGRRSSQIVEQEAMKKDLFFLKLFLNTQLFGLGFLEAGFSRLFFVLLAGIANGVNTYTLTNLFYSTYDPNNYEQLSSENQALMLHGCLIYLPIAYTLATYVIRAKEAINIEQGRFARGNPNPIEEELFEAQRTPATAETLTRLGHSISTFTYTCTVPDTVDPGDLDASQKALTAKIVIGGAIAAVDSINFGATRGMMPAFIPKRIVLNLINQTIEIGSAFLRAAGAINECAKNLFNNNIVADPSSFLTLSYAAGSILAFAHFLERVAFHSDRPSMWRDIFLFFGKYANILNRIVATYSVMGRAATMGTLIYQFSQAKGADEQYQALDYNPSMTFAIITQALAGLLALLDGHCQARAFECLRDNIRRGNFQQLSAVYGKIKPGVPGPARIESFSEIKPRLANVTEQVLGDLDKDHPWRKPFQK